MDEPLQQEAATRTGVEPGDPPRPRYQPLVIVLAAIVAGIVWDRFWPVPFEVYVAAAFLAVGLFTWFWRFEWLLPGAAAVMLLAVAVGGAWHHGYWRLYEADNLDRFASLHRRPVCFEAVVISSVRSLPPPEFDPMRPIPAGASTQLDLRASRVRDGQAWRPASGRARLIVADEVRGVQLGDRVRVWGRIARPSSPMNPGEFDYAAYLRAQRIRTIVTTNYAGCVAPLEPGSALWPGRWLASVRDTGDRLLQRYLNPRNKRLAAAVLLGAREQLSKDDKTDFFETGTVHLLVISGLHVGILCGSLLWVLRRTAAPRQVTALIVCGVAIGYMLLTDARPPVIRATILVLVFCIGAYQGRRSLGFNTLAAAALVVLALNPTDVFSTGAQLSFLSVAAMTWTAPWWMTIGREPGWISRVLEEQQRWAARAVTLVGRAARHMLLISTAVSLATLPLVMYQFHIVAPVGLVMNTLLWVPITLALITGFATLLLGSISALLGSAFGLSCNGLLAAIHASVATVRDVPGSHFYVPGPATWWIIGLYGGVMLLAAVPRLRPRPKWCAAMLAGWIVVGVAVPMIPTGPRPLRCSFIAVGHGLSVLVELPDGRRMLYDAGCLGPPAGASRAVSAVLWSRGITHLDAMIISHGDLDHYNAVPALLEQFSVGRIYIPPTMYDDPNPATDALEQAIGRSGVPVETVWAGHCFTGGDGCSLTVLHPTERGTLDIGDNANSLVLLVEYAGRRILLTGDLEPPGLDDVLAERPLDCDVLLAPHHGGRRSNTPALAQWCTPEWVVVSGTTGRGQLDELEGAYVDQGSQLLHTGRQGMVTVELRHDRLTVEGFKPLSEEDR